MKYKELHVTLADFPERLNRTFYIREKTPLIELGIIIGAAFEADFSHYFLFHKGKKMYEAQSWTEQFENKNAYSMMNYTLEDLGDKFTYEYDTGDCWYFDCQVTDLDYADMSDCRVRVVDGKGAGIFEDNHYTLDMYLGGEISPDTDHDDEDNGIFMPYNLMLDTLGDFDDPLDIEDLNEMLDAELDIMLEDFSSDYRRSDDSGYRFAFEDEFDEAMVECRNDLQYCYEKLGELMNGIGNLHESLSQKYGKEKAREVMKAVVMNHLVDLLEEDDK